MKSSKVKHHPGYQGDLFSTVEDEIEGAKTRLDIIEGTVASEISLEFQQTRDDFVNLVTALAESQLRINEIYGFAHNQEMVRVLAESALAALIAALDGELAELQDDVSDIDTELGDLTGDVGGLPAATQNCGYHGFIEFPDDKDYVLVLYIDHPFTITSTVTDCASGTCTATFKINTTALGGTANSVSTSEESQSHSSSNVAAIGDSIVLTVSANSSCEGLAFSINGTRTLAT